MKYLQTAGWSNLHPSVLQSPISFHSCQISCLYLQLSPYLHIPLIKNQHFLLLYLVSFFLSSECVLFVVPSCAPVFFFLLLTYLSIKLYASNFWLLTVSSGLSFLPLFCLSPQVFSVNFISSSIWVSKLFHC